MNLTDFAERAWLPDWLIRTGIRQLLARRIRQDCARTADDLQQAKVKFVADIRRGPLAEKTAAANAQHYEVPAEFFRLALGPRLKYSCCLYESPAVGIASAEEAMLRLTCQRADLYDGQDVLELGCGWGSLTLWIAEQFPASRITAVSNSHGQREFIEARARERGLTNVRIITADMRDFTIDEAFDRIVSVEMFEHMRNYELLLQRVSHWLTPEGKLFVHIFCHRDAPYLFETHGAANWMGRHFFTGGMMPSEDLLSHFNEHVAVAQSWRVSGLHYARTCEDWLKNLDQRRGEVTRLFAEQMPQRDARIAVQRWRMFFTACAELFRYRNGNEWFVAHYLLDRVERTSRSVRAREASRADGPGGPSYDTSTTASPSTSIFG